MSAARKAAAAAALVVAVTAGGAFASGAGSPDAPVTARPSASSGAPGAMARMHEQMMTGAPRMTQMSGQMPGGDATGMMGGW